MRKTQVSISDKTKILHYFVLTKVITEELFLHHFPRNRTDKLINQFILKFHSNCDFKISTFFKGTFF